MEVAAGAKELFVESGDLATLGSVAGECLFEVTLETGMRRFGVGATERGTESAGTAHTRDRAQRRPTRKIGLQISANQGCAFLGILNECMVPFFQGQKRSPVSQLDLSTDRWLMLWKRRHVKQVEPSALHPG